VWMIIIAAAALIIFGLLGFFICIQQRKNKSEQKLAERAIERELALAKEEGVEIPDDLEKKLSRFQTGDDDTMKKHSKSISS